MMNDHRVNGTTNNNNNRQQFDVTPNGPVDLFLRSESPRVQQILLHQQLREDIEKNSTGRVRYVDSELYLRNNERSPASSALEVQSRTLSIGDSTTTTTSKHVNKLINQNVVNKKVVDNVAMISNDQHGATTNGSADDDNHSRQGLINRTCQVCLIKEVRQDLMNMNKMVQERNEQITKKISKLKAKCLRSYFERQMMD